MAGPSTSMSRVRARGPAAGRVARTAPAPARAAATPRRPPPRRAPPPPAAATVVKKEAAGHALEVDSVLAQELAENGEKGAGGGGLWGRWCCLFRAAA